MNRLSMMMKSAAFTLCAAAFAASATPAVRNVTITPCEGEARVEVAYELQNAPAIVTVDFLTNGVSIGEANFAGVWGDVNRLVAADGSYKIQWRPDRDWNGNLAEVTAAVTAWDPMSPPDYLVVGLEASNDVRYYVSTNALPDGGLANDFYRRYRIVMRKIPAKGVRWRMGAPANEPGQKTRDGVVTDTETTETPHLVTLTDDYYIGIYPLTYRQYVCINGWISVVANASAGDDRYPRDNISYDELRGGGWPAGGHTVTENSFLAQMRAKTGVDFDLPTEAEWEYACRAGTGTGFNNGLEVTGMISSASLDPLAWYNGYDGPDKPGNVAHAVGLLQPNAWGLYDMHGGIWEWCLDWVAGSDGTIGANTETENPIGLITGYYRAIRGGCFATDAHKCRSGFRGGKTPATRDAYRGVRLVCPIGLKYPAAE